MDSQEKALLENATDDTSKKTYKSKEEILRRATDIVAENETPAYCRARRRTKSIFGEWR